MIEDNKVKQPQQILKDAGISICSIISANLEHELGEESTLYHELIVKCACTNNTQATSQAIKLIWPQFNILKG